MAEQKDKLLESWIWDAACSIRGAKDAPKGTQTNINIQLLIPWSIPVPSIEEQKEISNNFGAADQKIRTANRKRSQLQDIFRTVLHELMTANTVFTKLRSPHERETHP